jgi:hypothetical protein
MVMRFLSFCVLLFSLMPVAFAADTSRVQVEVSALSEGFLVKATIEAPVSVKTAWDVLTDFDHMTDILSNLTASKVSSRHGQILIVEQAGVAKFGLFSFPFNSQREIRLEPMRRILAKSLSGALKRMESEAQLSQGDDARLVHIVYQAEIVPDSVLARMFGASFIRHETEEQFRTMVAEMRRREH